MTTVLFALDTKTGTERWRFGAGDSVRSLCVSQDAVYCSDARGDLYAVEKKTGNLIWKANKAGKVYTALALDKGLVYYGGKDPFIHAIDAKTGEERWKFKAAGPCSAPVIADGVLYCASADRNLYAIDCSTGQEKWKYKCQNTLSLSPLITDNAIYVLDDDGYMWALR
jgi:outer membrane protein assembly factor BamB